MCSYFSRVIPLIEKIRTWQGEGQNCGKQMVLLRHKYCNRHCSFCDTWKKMGESDEKLYSLSDIDTELKDIDNVMITGGEPLMNRDEKTLQDKYVHDPDSPILDNYNATVAILKNCRYQYADIETNGSVNLVKFITDCLQIVDVDKSERRNEYKNINISWSPKFDSADDVNKHINTIQSINNLYDSYNNNKSVSIVNDSSIKIYPIIKLVICDDFSREFLYKIINQKYYPRNKVYLMPLGCNKDEIDASFPEIVELATKFGCNISTRMHLVHNFA